MSFRKQVLSVLLCGALIGSSVFTVCADDVSEEPSELTSILDDSEGIATIEEAETVEDVESSEEVQVYDSNMLHIYSMNLKNSNGEVVTEIKEDERYKLEFLLVSDENMSLDGLDLSIPLCSDGWKFLDTDGKNLVMNHLYQEESEIYKIQYQLVSEESETEGVAESLQIGIWTDEKKVIKADVPVTVEIGFQLTEKSNDEENETVENKLKLGVYDGKNILSELELNIAAGTENQGEKSNDEDANVEEIENGKEQAGASAQSVVMDEALRTAILRELGLEADHVLTQTDMEKLTSLSVYSSSGDKVKNIEGLQYAKNLSYLGLGGQAVQDFSVLSELSQLTYIGLNNNEFDILDFSVFDKMKKLERVDIDGNPKACAFVFDKYYEILPIQIVKGGYMTTREFLKNNSIYYSYNIDNEIEFQVENGNVISIEKEYPNVYLNATQVGKTTITATYLGITKSIPVECVASAGKIDESAKVNTLPTVNEYSAGYGALYNGSIWDYSGEKTVKISDDKKLKQYVSRRVYPTTHEYIFNYENTGYYENAGIDENNVLWYWGKKGQSDDTYVVTKIAENVKVLKDYGYLDNNNVFHFWKFAYSGNPNGKPVTYKTISNVNKVTESAVVYDNGEKSICADRIWPDEMNNREIEVYPYECKKYVGFFAQGYILDGNGTIWKGTDGNWTKYKAGEDINSYGYLKNGIYYDWNDKKIATNVSGLNDTYDVNFYITNNSEVYTPISTYENQTVTVTWKLNSKNVKDICSTYVLTKDGKVYLNGTEEGVCLMQSVAAVSLTFGGIIATRDDGSVWKLSGSKAPICMFSSKDIATLVTVPKAVTNLKAQAAGKNKVKLTWDKSENAEGYLIYAQKNGKYGYCGMTTKGTTFTDTKALDTDYNFYWVFPYVKDDSGKMHPGGCTKYVFAKGICDAVANLKAVSISGGVKLTWNKVADADGYLVYGKTASGKYGYVGMTAGTAFTDKKASKSEYNFYWVFSYHKNASGKMVVGGTPKYVYGKAR